MNARGPGTGGLVYSTDAGRMCPACRKPLGDCACAAQPRPVAQGDGIVRVSRETKGRGGKAVTLVRGLALDDAALTAPKNQRAAKTAPTMMFARLFIVSFRVKERIAITNGTSIKIAKDSISSGPIF
jgi:translation initiation factor 1 (eIF-1/SUI1)